eukprot:GHVT01030693.1.p1 GENE.GHVT01030693.1~~GHVT01030693.1.p1  ORF type:complete len:744 (+),score=183.14 GHVT01030693.1:605-2836(+)
MSRVVSSSSLSRALEPSGDMREGRGGAVRGARRGGGREASRGVAIEGGAHPDAHGLSRKMIVRVLHDPSSFKSGNRRREVGDKALVDVSPRSLSRSTSEESRASSNASFQSAASIEVRMEMQNSSTVLGRVWSAGTLPFLGGPRRAGGPSSSCPASAHSFGFTGMAASRISIRLLSDRNVRQLPLGECVHVVTQRLQVFSLGEKGVLLKGLCALDERQTELVGNDAAKLARKIRLAAYGLSELSIPPHGGERGARSLLPPRKRPRATARDKEPPLELLLDYAETSHFEPFLCLSSGGPFSQHVQPIDRLMLKDDFPPFYQFPNHDEEEWKNLPLAHPGGGGYRHAAADEAGLGMTPHFHHSSASYDAACHSMAAMRGHLDIAPLGVDSFQFDPMDSMDSMLLDGTKDALEVPGLASSAGPSWSSSSGLGSEIPSSSSSSSDGKESNGQWRGMQAEKRWKLLLHVGRLEQELGAEKGDAPPQQLQRLKRKNTKQKRICVDAWPATTEEELAVQLERTLQANARRNQRLDAQAVAGKVQPAAAPLDGKHSPQFPLSSRRDSFKEVWAAMEAGRLEWHGPEPCDVFSLLDQQRWKPPPPGGPPQPDAVAEGRHLLKLMRRLAEKQPVYSSLLQSSKRRKPPQTENVENDLEPHADFFPEEGGVSFEKPRAAAAGPWEGLDNAGGSFPPYASQALKVAQRPTRRRQRNRRKGRRGEAEEEREKAEGGSGRYALASSPLWRCCVGADL